MSLFDLLFIAIALITIAAVPIKHEDGFPISWFIIGYESWFRKPTIVRLS